MVVNTGFGEMLECTRESGRGSLGARFVDGVSGETVVAALVGVLWCEGFDPGETVSDGEIVVLLDATRTWRCKGLRGEYGGGGDAIDPVHCGKSTHALSDDSLRTAALTI